jgi:hypothetical protein
MRREPPLNPSMITTASTAAAADLRRHVASFLARRDIGWQLSSGACDLMPHLTRRDAAEAAAETALAASRRATRTQYKLP